MEKQLQNGYILINCINVQSVGTFCEKLLFLDKEPPGPAGGLEAYVAHRKRRRGRNGRRTQRPSAITGLKWQKNASWRQAWQKGESAACQSRVELAFSEEKQEEGRRWDGPRCLGCLGCLGCSRSLGA